MIYKDPPPDFKKEIDIVSCFVQCGDMILLLHRRPEKSNGNKWGLPAGKVESGETIHGAMKRELQEETGIEVDSEALNYFGHVWVRHNGHDFQYHMFSSIFDDVPTVILRLNEHQDFIWITPEESLQMNLVEDQGQCTQLFYGIA